jgi:O-antigen/teichoic acid export membrane protein
MSLDEKFFRSNHSQLLLLSGSLIAQVFSLISTFYVAHQFEPSIFGHYSFSVTTLALLVPISTGKIDLLIVNVKEAEAIALLFSVLRRIFFFSVIYAIIFFTIFLFFWDYQFAFAIQSGILVLLSNFVLNLAIVSIGLALRLRRFSFIAISGILQNGVTLVAQYLLLQIYKSLISLLLGFVLGRLAACLSIILYRKIRKLFLLSFSDLRKVVLHPTTKIDQKNLFQAFSIDQLTLYSPLIFIFFLNDPSLLGNTSLALTVALAPAILLTSAFSMNSVAVNRQHHGTSRDLIRVRNNRIFHISSALIYFFLMETFSELFFTTILNESWYEASILIKAFAIPLTFYIILLPYLQYKVGLGDTNFARQSNLYGAIGVIAFTVLAIILFLSFDFTLNFIGGLLIGSKIVGQLIHLVIANQNRGN